MVVLSNTVALDSLIAVDPIGLKQTPRTVFVHKWLNEFVADRARKKSSSNKTEDDRTSVENVALGKRAIREFGIYKNIWITSAIGEALLVIAGGKDFEHLATSVTFVDGSFTADRVTMDSLSANLAKTVRKSRAAPFMARVLSGPNIYHGDFTDAEPFAKFFLQSRQELEDAQSRVA